MGRLRQLGRNICSGRPETRGARPDLACHARRLDLRHGHRPGV